MEQNKKTYKADSFLSPNKFVAILIYILIIFILASLILYLIAYIYSSSNNILYNELKATYSLKSEEFDSLSDVMLKANAITRGISNVISYLLAALAIGFFTRDELKNDLFKLKEKRSFYLWFIPVSAILFVSISYGIDKLVQLGTTSSENQQQIVNIFKNGGMAPMIISTVILAPLVEEIIFRKCIFSLCGKRIILAYVISIIAFTLPHMLTTTASFGDWVLKAIPYITSGFMFALIYQLSGYNLYVTFIAHMLNNILAIILVFI